MLDWPVRTESGAEIAPPAAAFAEDHAAPLEARRPRRLGLAGRVLVITIGFVLLAMALFYAARLAAFRETWLHNKFALADTVVQTFDAGGATELPRNWRGSFLPALGSNRSQSRPPPADARSQFPASRLPPLRPSTSTARHSSTAWAAPSARSSPNRERSFR